jgi:hypothetical protein
VLVTSRAVIWTPLDVVGIHISPISEIDRIGDGSGETGGAGGGVGAVGVELLHALKPRAKNKKAALMVQ